MKFHIKRMASPLKLIGCFLFVCVLPIAMYVPTYYDFVNVSTLYLPFVAIVLFSDATMLDKASGMEEITVLCDRKPGLRFLQRFPILLGTLLVYILLANGIFRWLQHFRGNEIWEPISFFAYSSIVAGGCLFFGALSMAISRVTDSIPLGYGCSIVYWVFWNINCQRETVFNPFPFMASPTAYELPLGIVYLFSLGLITLTCFLSAKSPFYLSDKREQFLTSLCRRR